MCEAPATTEEIHNVWSERWGLPLFALGATGPGCGVGRHVQKGIDSYRAGQYQAALQKLQPLETREVEMNTKGRLRYLVHRGLSHYRLGQRTAAFHWLLRGEEIYRHSSPRWLPRHAVAEMGTALRELRSPTPSAALEPDVVVIQ